MAADPNPNPKTRLQERKSTFARLFYGHVGDLVTRSIRESLLPGDLVEIVERGEGPRPGTMRVTGRRIVCRVVSQSPALTKAAHVTQLQTLRYEAPVADASPESGGRS